MLQRRLLVLMLLSRVVWPVEPSPRSNHLNSIIADAAPSAIDPAAAAAATTYDKQQQQQPQQQSQAWQPSAAHSNWIILQAATAAAGASNHRYDTAPSHSATRTQLLRSYGARNDFQLQPLPGNYYAYNRSTGNYQLPPPAPTPAGSSARVVQPYVLATSKVRRRPVPLGIGAVDTLPQDNNFVRHNDRNDNNNDNTDGENNEIDTNDAGNKSDAGDNMPQTRVVRQDTDSSNKNSPNGDNGIAIGDGDANTFEAEAELNEILLPLENALDRVRHFCDVVKRFISDVDEDTDDKGHSASPATNAARVAVTARSDVPPSVSAEVQGRHAITTLPPRSLAKSLTAAGAFGWPALSAGPAAASVGTGRAKKLKKKLRKLLLPLLIAYKLKFLTLIPVLIGGLTLLVGTTGLAGFFFALFTAVMSLKSGGGKSVSVKKI